MGGVRGVGVGEWAWGGSNAAACTLLIRTALQWLYRPGRLMCNGSSACQGTTAGARGRETDCAAAQACYAGAGVGVGVVAGAGAGAWQHSLSNNAMRCAICHDSHIHLAKLTHP